MTDDSFTDDGLYGIDDSSGGVEQFIDNNEFVFPDRSKPTSKLNNEYILMLNDEVILTGLKQVIEDKLKFLIYQKNINVDKITVLKKVNIKIGIFLE